MKIPFKEPENFKLNSYKQYKTKGVIGDIQTFDIQEAEFLLGVIRDSEGLISLSITPDCHTEQIVIPINKIIEDFR